MTAIWWVMPLKLFFSLVRRNAANILNDDRGLAFENHPGKLLSIPVQLQNVTQISSKVDDRMDCLFACTGKKWCRTVNFKLAPEKDGKYICEQLSADNFTHQSYIKKDENFTLLSIKNPCDEKPCQNDGSCFVHLRIDRYCICQGYYGQNCQMKIVPKSCSDLNKKHPKVSSGNYVIDPDGQSLNQPFTVYCDMTDKKGVGVTVVSHNREARTRAKNCLPCTHNVTYKGVSMTQLAKLTEISTNCKQFIKFECKGGVAFVSESAGWWVSRDGVKQMYWGGATPGSKKCACGMTNNCSSQVRACNCNNKITDATWRFDNGFLIDKSSLPVTQMRFTDTNDKKEDAYHTLGKLKCYG